MVYHTLQGTAKIIVPLQHLAWSHITWSHGEIDENEIETEMEWFRAEQDYWELSIAWYVTVFTVSLTIFLSSSILELTISKFDYLLHPTD